MKWPYQLALAVLAGCVTIGEQSPPQLAGSSWQVVAINGQSAGGWIRFEADRFAGNFGCNRVGVGYRLDGDTFKSGVIQTTRMACLPVSDGPTPMISEDAALAVIRGGPRLIWDGSDRLVFRTAAGEIMLLRQEGSTRRRP